MDSEEQSTIPNQTATLEIIVQMIGDLRHYVETRFEQQETSFKNEIGSLKAEIVVLKTKIGELDDRILATEIQLQTVQSLIHKSISVSSEALSVVHSLRGEIIAMRRESSEHGRDLEILKEQIKQPA